MFKYRIFVYTAFIATLFSLKVNAQVSFQFNQYMYNQYVINPAYAGSNEALEITSSFRKQWFGVEGSPFSQVISAHTPLRNKNVGLGMLVANDKIGIHNNFQISTSYAYKIKIDRRKSISVGLQGGVYQSMSDYTEISQSFSSFSDPAFNENLPQNINPTFGTGIFYYTKDFYAGVSVLNMEAQNIFENAQTFITAGKTFMLTNNVVLQPGVLVNYSPDKEITADIFSNLVLNDVLWLGVSYRTFNSINMLTQLQITPQIRFGYSYGAPTGGLGKISTGTHEIMLQYRFSFYRARVVTPRYF